MKAICIWLNLNGCNYMETNSDSGYLKLLLLGMEKCCLVPYGFEMIL